MGEHIRLVGQRWTQTRGPRLSLLLCMIVLVGAGLFVGPQPPPVAAQTTVKVNAFALRGWTLTPSSATSAFATGPAAPNTPPLGTGSLRFAVSGNSGVSAITTRAYTGTLLSNVSQLSYSTLRFSGAPADRTVALRLDVFSPGWSGQVFFEPRLVTPPVALGTGWQAWNAVDGTARWYAVGTGTTVNPCTTVAPCTWADLKTSLPGARVSDVLMTVSGIGATAFDGRLDALTITTTGPGASSTTFDFEATPNQCTTTCYVTPGGDDANAGTQASPKRTISGALRVVSANGRVNVAAGTYTSPASDPPLTIRNPVTIVGPNATINPNGTTPRVAEAIINGNVQWVIDAANVTIEGLTFSGIANSVVIGNSERNTAQTVRIARNRFINITNTSIGIGLSNGIGTDWTITENLADGSTGNQWFVNASRYRNLSVTKNVIRNGANGVLVLGDSSAISTKATISENTIDTMRLIGVQVAFYVNDVTVSNNIITKANTDNVADRGAIRLYGTELRGPVRIAGNTISSSRNAIAVRDTENLTGKDVLVTCNLITGGTGSNNVGVYHGGAGVLNAQANWWGAATGPTHPSNAAGTGQAVRDSLSTPVVGTGTVNFANWLTTANCLLITTQPASQIIFAGQSANLSVVAGGSGTITYQWYQGESGNTSNPVTGATTSALTVSPTSTTSYWVRVANKPGPDGSIDSATATVTVNGPPSITTQPAGQSVNPGQTATLSVVATGEGLNYQWYEGSSPSETTPVAGATTASFTTPAINAPTSYWVKVSNLAGSANSETATITLNPAPTITTQPASQTIPSGQTATLNVVVAGDGPYTYQWYQGAKDDTSNPIAGATAASFTTPALTTPTSYWVKVTGPSGSTSSEAATITPTTAPVTVFSSTPLPSSNIVFGTVAVNSSSTRSLIISNTGTATLNVSASSGLTAPFSISPATAFTVAPGAPARTLTITCSPTTAGTFNATLTFTTNDGARPTVSYPLTCTSAAGGTDRTVFVPMISK